jgi:hypothetical protein
MTDTETPVELSSLLEREEEREEDHSQPDAETLSSEPQSQRGVALAGPFQQAIWAWVTAVITFITLACTIVLAWRTADIGSWSPDPLEDATARLRIVRILAEINTLLLTALVAMSGKIVALAASSSRRGVSMPMWFAMSPTTGYLGLLALLFWGKRSNGKPRTWHRGWIITRYVNSRLSVS